MSFKLSLGRAAITATPMYTNEAIAALYPNDLATTEYLYYALPTLALETSADRAVKGRTLNKAKLRALRLILPPLSEQRKIAAILSSVDDAIEKTQAVDPQLISHFLRGLDFSAHSGKTAVPGVNRNHLHRTTVIFPPDVSEQRIIATILSSADDTTEKTGSLIRSAQALKSALMSALLTGKLRVTPDA